MHRLARIFMEVLNYRGIPITSRKLCKKNTEFGYESFELHDLQLLNDCIFVFVFCFFGLVTKILGIWEHII